VKENHVRGLCQLSLERATVIEGKWVACLIQECVIANVYKYEHLVILYSFTELVDFLGLAAPERFYF
jgi:hypothetical protein